MVEQWSNTTDYETFFTECAPNYCAYTITERPNLIIIITTLIGLVGGLNIALHMTSPVVIRMLLFFVKINESKSKQKDE